MANRNDAAARMAAALHLLADSSLELRSLAEAYAGGDLARAVRLTADASPEVKAAIGGLTMLDCSLQSVETGLAMCGRARHEYREQNISRAQMQLKSFLARGGYAS